MRPRGTQIDAPGCEAIQETTGREEVLRIWRFRRFWRVLRDRSATASFRRRDMIHTALVHHCFRTILTERPKAVTPWLLTPAFLGCVWSSSDRAIPRESGNRPFILSLTHAPGQTGSWLWNEGVSANGGCTDLAEQDKQGSARERRKSGDTSGTQ